MELILASDSICLSHFLTEVEVHHLDGIGGLKLQMTNFICLEMTSWTLNYPVKLPNPHPKHQRYEKNIYSPLCCWPPVLAH